MSEPTEESALLWPEAALDQFAFLCEDRSAAFIQRVQQRAEELTARLGGGPITWVQVQEAVEQLEREEERRR